jgi:hypothetical protein
MLVDEPLRPRDAWRLGRRRGTAAIAARIALEKAADLGCRGRVDRCVGAEVTLE